MGAHLRNHEMLEIQAHIFLLIALLVLITNHGPRTTGQRGTVLPQEARGLSPSEQEEEALASTQGRR